MVKIYDITNTIFASKTYILYREGEDESWLVDIGDIEPVLSFLESKNLTVAGVFITHAHFDHIYGLESLVQKFPRCRVYCTEYCQEALASERLNMSRYHGSPINYARNNIVIVNDGMKLQLFENEPWMFFYETPGHNPGCLTMVMSDVIFTGDSFIPGVGANTKVPKADKVLAEQSLKRILELAEGKKILSGHKTNVSAITQGVQE